MRHACLPGALSSSVGVWAEWWSLKNEAKSSGSSVLNSNVLSRKSSTSLATWGEIHWAEGKPSQDGAHPLIQVTQTAAAMEWRLCSGLKQYLCQPAVASGGRKDGDGGRVGSRAYGSDWRTRTHQLVDLWPVVQGLSMSAGQGSHVAWSWMGEKTQRMHRVTHFLVIAETADSMLVSWQDLSGKS